MQTGQQMQLHVTFQGISPRCWNGNNRQTDRTPDTPVALLACETSPSIPLLSCVVNRRLHRHTPEHFIGKAAQTELMQQYPHFMGKVYLCIIKCSWTPNHQPCMLACPKLLPQS